MWMLVSKQKLIDNLQTSLVLFRSILLWTFACFNKIKQEITHYGCFKVKHETLYS